MAAELTSYITKAREKNIPDEEIKNQLISVGWPSEQVTAALTQTSDLPVPLPPPGVQHVGMWVGFLYILFFISLYVLASAIAGIFHAWIDKPTFNSPDYSDFSWYSLPEAFGIQLATLVRGYIAAIIVSYPLFLILFITLKNQLTKQPMTRNLRSRKILIYITLIGTFLILLGNVIVTCYDLLAGNITENIIRHLLVTLLIAGPIFFYFFSEVKNDKKST